MAVYVQMLLILEKDFLPDRSTTGLSKDEISEKLKIVMKARLGYVDKFGIILPYYQTNM